MTSRDLACVVAAGALASAIPTSCIPLPPPLVDSSEERGGSGGQSSTAGGSTTVASAGGDEAGGGGAGGSADGGAGGVGEGGGGGEGEGGPLPVCPPGTVDPDGCATIVQLAPGDFHSCALASDGYVRCWGSNLFGELGLPSLPHVSHVPPTVVEGLDGVDQIISGAHHSCALAGTQARCWGANDMGQLGTGDVEPREEPTPTGVQDIVLLSSKHRATCALTAGGEVKCWGFVLAGQAWDGTDYTLSAATVQGLGEGPAITALAVGHESACALLGDDDVRCWGDNEYGKVGDGTGVDSDVGTPVTGAMLSPVHDLAAGGAWMCAAGGEQRRLQCWGPLSTLSLETYWEPTTMTTVEANVVTVGVGWNHVCLLDTGGNVSCFGRSYHAELGPSGGFGAPVTVPVPVLGNVDQLAVGWQHNCALLRDGQVRCWGRNQHGQTSPGDPLGEIATPTAVTFAD